MKDKTKRDKIVLCLGWGLILDSVSVLGMFIIGILQGSFAKMPASKEVETILLICTGGLLMLCTGYYFVNKEYAKPVNTSSKTEAKK